jgi:hypothetical protein
MCCLAACGIRLYFLPPYRPALNRIEPYCGGIKHHDLVEGHNETTEAPADAVDEAFTRPETRLLEEASPRRDVGRVGGDAMSAEASAEGRQRVATLVLHGVEESDLRGSVYTYS